MTSRRPNPDPSSRHPRDAARSGVPRGGRETEHFPEERRAPRTTEMMGHRSGFPEEEPRRSEHRVSPGGRQSYDDDDDIDMGYENTSTERRGPPTRAPARETREDLYLEHRTIAEKTYLLRAKGISRDIMHSELGRFLGPNATSRAREESGGVIEFRYKGYRMLTDEMLADLRHLSLRQESERKPRSGIAPHAGRRHDGYDQPQPAYRTPQGGFADDEHEWDQERPLSAPSTRRPREIDHQAYREEQRSRAPYDEPHQTVPGLFSPTGNPYTSPQTGGFPTPQTGGFPTPVGTQGYQISPNNPDYHPPRVTHTSAIPPNPARNVPPQASQGMYGPSGHSLSPGIYQNAQGQYVTQDGRVVDYRR